MKTLLILALAITGCSNPKVVRAGVGPDYTPTPTASKMVIKDVDAMTVYVLTGEYDERSEVLGVYKTRELADAMVLKYGPSYVWYIIDEIEVTE